MSVQVDQEQHEQQVLKCNTLFEEGKLAFAKKEFEASVNKLGEACQLLDQVNGVLAPENGDAYFLYGKALLQLAIQQNTVLGLSAQESASEVEAQQEEAKRKETKVKNPLLQLSDVPEFVSEEDKEEVEEDNEQDEEGEGDGETNNAEEDFEAAWDILDVARVIFEKSEDNETRLKLADVHLCLGDISLETEKFNEALADYEKAIEIKERLLKNDNRELAEAHYKYALALEFSTEKSDQAIPELQKVIDVLNKRLEALEKAKNSNDEGKGKEKATETDESVVKEISEIRELIPDMKLKIEELSTRQATEKEAAELLKAVLNRNQSTEKVKEISASTPVNDLTSLVKRKAVQKADEGANGAEKKQRLN
ncbi:hypothetical protein BDF20DRAFT_811061 [Mycotypha africana]|uniref:uncharacterized protein n=1 Tax=Mycotypha africana TaxID=64632 RepID=UPI0023014733|nr:uncharacterized protein BDF20DRAFT_811061 [Mycotypha africana]KAI8991604.1 hypothetical protein BDF20DRAFT_811061 [Mycotypha africana]